MIVPPREDHFKDLSLSVSRFRGAHTKDVLFAHRTKHLSHGGNFRTSSMGNFDTILTAVIQHAGPNAQIT